MTYILTRFDGVKIEYRRAAEGGDIVLNLEHRELKPDGTPHDDQWYSVSDSHLLWMQHHGHADQGIRIIDALYSRERSLNTAAGA